MLFNIFLLIIMFLAQALNSIKKKKCLCNIDLQIYAIFQTIFNDIYNCYSCLCLSSVVYVNFLANWTSTVLCGAIYVSELMEHLEWRRRTRGLSRSRSGEVDAGGQSFAVLIKYMCAVIVVLFQSMTCRRTAWKDGERAPRCLTWSLKGGPRKFVRC